MILSKRSNGNYYIFFNQENGKRTCISTKCKIKSDALKFLADFQRKTKERRSKQQVIKLTDYISRFLQFSNLNHTQKTVSAYSTTLKFFVNFFDKEPLLKDITSKKINDYFTQRINKSSIYQARKDLICLNSLFNRAVTEEFLTENPCKNIKRFKLPQKQPLYFTENEFDKLLSVVPAGAFKNLIILAVNTGMRQAELLNLQWDNINIKNRMIILDNRTVVTKSKKIYKVPLNIKSLQVLNELEQTKTGNRVFNFNADFVTHKFKKYVRKAGINDKLHFHNLRSTYASWLVQKGTSINVIKELLHHADIQTSMIYSFISQDNLVDAVNLLD